MAKVVTWYFTHVTRTSGSDPTWETVTGEPSIEVEVWFGTQAEWDAVTNQGDYNLYIIDEVTAGEVGLVDSDELRAALLRYDTSETTISFNLSTNAAYVGTSTADYTGDGVSNPEAAVAFGIDGNTIENSTNAYMITLDPVTATSFAAEFKPGKGNFDPYYPGSLTEEPPCFAAGTMIATPDGERAVETLQPGDLVLTRDHGAVPVRLVLTTEITASRMMAEPSLRPIRIARGALGADMPSQDLLVSPQHRILVRSKIAQRMFGAPEVLVAAKQLVDLDGIELAQDVDGCVYCHMILDQHEVVFSNGAETESLYPGPVALRSLGRAARDELYALFPQLRDADAPGFAEARTLVAGRRGRRLASRHDHSHQSLVS